MPGTQGPEYRGTGGAVRRIQSARCTSCGVVSGQCAMFILIWCRLSLPMSGLEASALAATELAD